MAETLRILAPGGTSYPADGVSLLYTVPAGKQAVVSLIVLGNPNPTACTVRLHAVRSGSSATSAGNALLWDHVLAPGETLYLRLGVSLAPGDQLLRATSSGTGSTCMAFGQEVDL